MYQDTIVAIATPLGEGALGVVRMSGAEAFAIARRVFSGRLEDHHVVYGHLREPDTGALVDQAMGVYLAAPQSYTREDTVEFTCHGGALLLQRALEALLREGARQAEPGEFTLRAFLNGRIDLTQAEAVLDVIQAKTQLGLNLALQGLEGRLSKQVREARAALLEPLAYLTALVDFPEDEVGQQDVDGELAACLQQLRSLLDSADQGMVYRQGVRTAIVGRPNAGKSSLLNLLLGRERAIVTATPGTTRDTVEEVASVNGVPFVLVDTAGIRTTVDAVEALGVERSRQSIATADMVLLVVDTSEPLDEETCGIAAALADKQVLVVANKRDLPDRLFFDGKPQAPAMLLASLRGAGKDAWPCVGLSALTGEGFDALAEAMTRAVLGGRSANADAAMVTNPRHKVALVQAVGHLEAGLVSYRQGMPADFVTIDLTAAVAALGEITGENAEQDLLDVIFSRFCIGK